jgi:hypothetical protein
LSTVLSPVCQGHLVMILSVFRRIAVGCIQLSLDCPKNPTRWHLQIFFTHLLLSFVHHHLPKLVTFSSNLLKKFLATLVSQSHLLVCCQLKDSIEIIVINDDINHILQFCLYELTNNVTTKVAIPKLRGNHSLSSWYTTLT